MGQAGAVVGKSQSSVVSAGPRHAVGKCSLELQFLCLDGNSSLLPLQLEGTAPTSPGTLFPVGWTLWGLRAEASGTKQAAFPALI